MAVEPASLFSIEGRRVAITGAGRGIGAALALGFAKAGCELVLIGRPGAQEGTRCGIEKLGRPVAVVDVDLADREAAGHAAAKLAAMGPLDVLVNNAGVIERSDALEIALDEWDRVLEVNLSAAFALTQAVAAPMLSRGSGKVINIASVLGFQGGFRVASYAASKHALVGLTRALANEWASRGVQVNAIAPGYIVTDQTEAIRDDPERLAEITARIPAQRWGSGQDLLGAAIFLASAASDYVNGHVLAVDGGWSGR
jgi:2-deoxy-D-gluconate 3-dehydrogenase